MSRKTTLGAETAQALREQHLQIADGALFVVVAARIRRERRAALIVHANVMAELVQQRVRRRVRARVDGVADQAALRDSPQYEPGIASCGASSTSRAP